MHIAHGGCRLAGGSAKAAEILLTQQALGLAVHQACIQGPPLPTDLRTQECRTHGSIGDDIAIAPGLCTESGMKVPGYRHRPMQSNIERQVGVPPQHPGFAAACSRGIEMHHLAVSMNACVSAARTVYPNRTGRYLLQGLFQGALYGQDIKVGLRLPAAVAAAIIFYPAGDSTTR